jgi:hypothetical protein
MSTAPGRFRDRRDLVCSYCRLPVRLNGERAHPGYGVVEQVTGLPDTPLGLHLMHRFCGEALRSTSTRRALRYGQAVRRARLGRATECYDRGQSTKH